MCYIDGQKSKYSVLNECNRMLKYNVRYSIKKKCHYKCRHIFKKCSRAQMSQVVHFYGWYVGNLTLRSLLPPQSL
jgi:hypothetical protein